MQMADLPAFLAGLPVPGMEAGSGAGGQRRSALLGEVQRFLRGLNQVRPRARCCP